MVLGWMLSAELLQPALQNDVTQSVAPKDIRFDI